MLRIAICDDDPKSLEQISQLLHAYFRVRPNLTGRINAFTSGKSLLEQIETEPGFDLYLLDILMPGQNGIEIGRACAKQEERGKSSIFPPLMNMRWTAMMSRPFFIC